MGLRYNKQLSMLELKKFFISGIEKEGQVILTKKLGRASFSVEDSFAVKKQKEHKIKLIPHKSVKHDNTDHFTIYKTVNECAN